jgi:hypothetical protein
MQYTVNYCRTSCRSFLLLTESRFISRFIYRKVMPLCKLLIILCGFYMKNNNSYTAHFVPVFCLYYLNFHLRQHLTQFFSFLCYPLPHMEGTLIFLLTVYILNKRTKFPSNIVHFTKPQSRI